MRVTGQITTVLYRELSSGKLFAAMGKPHVRLGIKCTESVGPDIINDGVMFEQQPNAQTIKVVFREEATLRKIDVVPLSDAQIELPALPDAIAAAFSDLQSGNIVYGGKGGAYLVGEKDGNLLLVKLDDGAIMRGDPMMQYVVFRHWVLRSQPSGEEILKQLVDTTGR